VKHAPLKHPSGGILSKATSLLAAITLLR
jgi:hypothetical protein